MHRVTPDNPDLDCARFQGPPLCLVSKEKKNVLSLPDLKKNKWIVCGCYSPLILESGMNKTYAGHGH